MRPQYFQEKSIPARSYHLKTANDYLENIKPDILAGFTAEQLAEIKAVLNQAIPKPSPKLIDLRFVVDLIISRFYVVLFVGKDRRQKNRKYVPNKIAKVGNIMAVIFILIAANLVISSFILLFAYLLKSLIGINLFPGHLQDYFK